MNAKELTQALNQIHLECSVIETLLAQYKAHAKRENIKHLARVLSDIHMNFISDITEEWCREELEKQIEKYADVCRQIMYKPQIISINPPMLVDVFNVLLRSSYKYLSSEDTKHVMIITANMMEIADSQLSEGLFNELLYWFEALDFDEPWEAVARIPRVKEMIQEEQDKMMQQHIERAIKNGKNFPKA